ncbi:MAG: glycerol-3-phosphate acyltransferase [Chloroflexota bacterium]|nr:glycerol-3-phosphate acyltransferase [Chloroflexota bacterium]MDE2941272.1 glycerol-3-phosphate acyltransferase [Chloroflexota bacterium]MDE3267794.1 glycerol-3-phosphate acyltransferase [Chloroflexota bacterium]
MLTDAALVLLGYLIGSIPMAYAVGRVSRKIDIRRFGSGNAGASNVWVQVGKGIGLAVFAFDMLVKGSIPAYVAWEFGTDPWVAVAAGLAAVAGHNWSVYLGLTGGRGITVTIGVLLVLAWPELLAAVLIASVGWLVTRSSALWVGLALLLTPAWSVALGSPPHVTGLCTGLVLLAAAKRMLSNGEQLPEGEPWHRALFHRLLFDRDAGSREDWVFRRPPEV